MTPLEAEEVGRIVGLVVGLVLVAVVFVVSILDTIRYVRVWNMKRLRLWCRECGRPYHEEQRGDG